MLPAPISPEMREKVRTLAVRAFRALDLSGVARIDFLMNAETEELYINEVNTIPGSLSFYLFAPTGLPYDELLDRLIELAFKRQRQRDSLTFSYETNIFDTKATGMLKGVKGG